MDHDTRTSASFGREPSFVARVRLLNAVWRHRVVVVSLIAADISLALLFWGLSHLFRATLDVSGGVGGVALATLGSSLAVWVSLRALLGLYPGYGLDSVELLKRHTYSVFAALAILSLFALGLQVGELLSRLLLGLSFLGLLIFGPLVRKIVTSTLRSMWLWGKPVIVLSYKDTGEKFISLLGTEWGLGYMPVALFDYNILPAGQSYQDTTYEETLADAEDFARQRGVDTVIFAMPYTRREQIASLVAYARTSFQNVLIVPNLSGVTNSAVVARNIGGTLAVEIKHNLLNPWALRTKRIVDLVLTVTGGILILPLIAVLAAMVYFESGGPVFYRDKRMGHDGKLFSCLKFRTMVAGAENMLEELLNSNPEARTEYEMYHKLRDDPRVTKVGRFLRRTSVDELPQIWNVITGDMSLVGPRPYLPRESKEIGVTQSEILRVPPGITGPWQVAGRNHTSFGERVDMDAYYVRDWSVWLDAVLLARTAKIVFLGRGAY